MGTAGSCTYYPNYTPISGEIMTCPFCFSSNTKMNVLRDSHEYEISASEIKKGDLVLTLNGTETVFTVKTDETTVGAALLNAGLIAGDDTEYGLYVKTVNGVVADYDVDQTFWGFYIDDEFASTGVDSTTLNPESVYTFKKQK